MGRVGLGWVGCPKQAKIQNIDDVVEELAQDMNLIAKGVANITRSLHPAPARTLVTPLMMPVVPVTQCTPTNPHEP